MAIRLMPQAVLTILMCLCCFLPNTFATIQLPSDERKRTPIVEDLRRLCKDFHLNPVEKDGKWILEKGERKIIYEIKIVDGILIYEQKIVSDYTPKGCKLVCDAIDHPKKIIFIGVKDSNNPQTRGFPGGSRVRIEFPTRMTDENILSYKSGETEPTVPIPRHIAMGHELIHALHKLNGTSATGDNHESEAQAIDGSKGPEGHGITENDLRDENWPKIPDRVGVCAKPLF